MLVTLGLDTSCYTTSAAAVDEHGNVAAFSRQLLPVASGSRGLRQSEAVFTHLKQMPEQISAVMEQLHGIDAEIAAVCVSSRPRGDESSYMPVFMVGRNFGQVLSDALDVPLFETSHQLGHIAAGLIGNSEPDSPYLALHLSGGTTDLLRIENEDIAMLGGSADLHAGQLIDRIGVAMGLPFPAGPSLEKLAMANSEAIGSLIPVSFEKGKPVCHISGAENQAIRWIRQDSFSHERIAAEVFDFLARTVSRLVLSSGTDCGTALIVGGVASSALLREMLERRMAKQKKPIRLVYGEPRFSSDNAAGVAYIGMKKYLSGREGTVCLQL